MATDPQLVADRRGGISSRTLTRLFTTSAVAGTGTVSGSFSVPEGAHLSSVQVEVPAAISGTPTTCNFRVGSAAAGQQVVADVDLKAQGHTVCTIVAAFDKIAGVTTYFWQMVTTGGTAPAGAFTVIVDYFPPNLV